MSLHVKNDQKHLVYTFMLLFFIMFSGFLILALFWGMFLFFGNGSFFDYIQTIQLPWPSEVSILIFGFIALWSLDLSIRTLICFSRLRVFALSVSAVKSVLTEMSLGRYYKID